MTAARDVEPIDKVTQRLSTRQLAKKQANELIPTAQSTRTMVTFVTVYRSLKGVTGKVFQKLMEYGVNMFHARVLGAQNCCLKNLNFNANQWTRASSGFKKS